MDDGDVDGGGGEGSEDAYRSKAKPVLVLLSDLYSEDNSISVHDSRLSSCPAYTYCLLYQLTTALMKLQMILV